MKNLYKAGVGFVLFTMASIASAALPLVVGTTLTDIQTDSLALIDLVWPVVGVITGALPLILINGFAKNL